MFKNMKLGAKIGSGFAALILIAVTLGGLAVWSMYGVKSTTTTLADAYVPAATLANEVEGGVTDVMLDARVYGVSEDPKLLEKARTSLVKVKKDLETAKAHADKYDLPVMAEQTAKAAARMVEYEQLINETADRTEAMGKDKEAMNTAATQCMKAWNDFLGSQMKDMETDVAKAFSEAPAAEAKADALAAEATRVETAKVDSDKTEAAEILERAKKIALTNDIIDLTNAIRIGAWKAMATRDIEEFATAQKTFDEINRKIDDLKAITRQEMNLKDIATCREASKAYLAAMASFVGNWEGREKIGAKRLEVSDAACAAADAIAKANMDKTADGSQEAAASLSMSSTTMIVGLSVAVVVGILLAVFITRSIVKPIARVIIGLTDGSQQVSAASGQVSGASQSLAEGSSEQASSLEETSSSLEEMASMTKQNAANAKQANSLADEALGASSRGDEAVKRMADAIGRIKQSSDETARIIKVIDEIAFQTNLLALNAAVEAARAGEAGKGFAVVAEEVRNLAQRSAEAAKNTAQLIDGAQKNADDGVKVTEDVTEALTEIGIGIKKVTDLLGEVAAASDEQSRGVDQINVAVGQMDQVTQQVAANAEESAAASEELSAQAEQLMSVVADLARIVGGAAAAQGQGQPVVQRAVHAAAPVRTQTAGKAPKAKAAKAAAVHIPLNHAEASHAEQDDHVLAKF